MDPVESLQQLQIDEGISAMALPLKTPPSAKFTARERPAWHPFSLAIK